MPKVQKYCLKLETLEWTSLCQYLYIYIWPEISQFFRSQKPLIYTFEASKCELLGQESHISQIYIVYCFILLWERIALCLNEKKMRRIKENIVPIFLLAADKTLMYHCKKKSTSLDFLHKHFCGRLMNTKSAKFETASNSRKKAISVWFSIHWILF